jgi:hypothetical protein
LRLALLVHDASRTGSARTSENSVKAKFAEFFFQALG